MTTPQGIQVKVVEDGVSVTGFTGAVALSRQGEAMGMFEDAERHLGWIKERQRGRPACLPAGR